MDKRKLMYIAIGVVCALALILGIVATVKPKVVNETYESSINIGDKKENTKTMTQEELKNSFYNIFDNKIHLTQYDTSKIKKYDDNNEIVYTVYQKKESTGSYEVDITLPMININSEISTKFNNITQTVFANKANEVFKQTKGTTIYSITYTGYINGDIMSVIIKSTLKENASAQRVMVQTYNYNLVTNKEATIDDVIKQRGTDNTTIENKIQTEVKKSIEETNKLKELGYEVYSRDLNNDMYKVNQTSEYFLGENGELYIIYAYGNKDFTSEMDIIII